MISVVFQANENVCHPASFFYPVYPLTLYTFFHWNKFHKQMKNNEIKNSSFHEIQSQERKKKILTIAI